MKITKPKLKHYIIVLILIFIGYFSLKTTGITVSDKSWKCHFAGEKCTCKVHFKIQNESHKVSDLKISLRGVQYLTKGKRQSLRILGEKYLDIKIYPENPVELTEHLNYNENRMISE